MSKQYLDISLWTQWCCQWHHYIQWVIKIKMRWNITFSVMWCHLSQLCCHVMLTALLTTPFCSLCGDNWNKMQHDIFVMWCWCWLHVTLIASSIPQVHLLVQDNQNEMQQDLFSYLTHLALVSASCYVKGIVNNTTVFIRLRQLRQCM